MNAAIGGKTGYTSDIWVNGQFISGIDVDDDDKAERGAIITRQTDFAL